MSLKDLCRRLGVSNPQASPPPRPPSFQLCNAMEDSASQYCGCPTGRVRLTSTKHYHYLLLVTGPRTTAKPGSFYLLARLIGNIRDLPSALRAPRSLVCVCSPSSQPSSLKATSFRLNTACAPLWGPPMASLAVWDEDICSPCWRFAAFLKVGFP